MKATALGRRLQEIEQLRTYRIASLADLVVLLAWRQSGDPRTPRPEDVVWDSNFEKLWDSCWKRSHESDGS